MVLGELLRSFGLVGIGYVGKNGVRITVKVIWAVWL